MYCALGSQWWTYNLQKFFLGSCIHLLVQKFFLCIGITYLSLSLSNLFRSTLSSNCALVFRLGQNLSNIPRFILSKQKIPLMLPLLEHKAFRSYLFSSDLPPSLAQSFASQAVDLRTELSFFSSVPSNHSFRSRKRNHLLAQGQTQGLTLQQRTSKTLNTGPFGKTCEVGEVSPKIEAGGVVGLRCLQPSWDTNMWLQHLT
jgi:hypothetical protein